MPRVARRPAPDQAQRDEAVRERERNVLIDAGAGTGKTTILVDRLVEMVAPTANAHAVPIERLAAITFTRKGAGELRLRIRERLLQELAEAGLGEERDRQLREALSGLDTAHVGTIHSFADRLLRLRPVEAELSPSYEVVEDEAALVRETFDVLVHAIESGTLAAEVAGTPAAPRAEEVSRTLLFALAAGLRVESRETPWWTFYGLEALVAGFIQNRDLPPSDAEPPPLDAPAFRATADEFVRAARPVQGDSPGALWIQRAAAVLHRLRELTEPYQILRGLRSVLEQAPRNVTKRDTFAGDDTAWQVWKLYSDGGKTRARPLSDDLRAPLDRFLATRLVRLFPVAVTLYEKVKARHRALDQLDLLVKLRNLLARDRAARGEYQRLFDHIFVDEFQDTDPLQAEIVLFLCEREPVAARWDDIALRDGSLTLVGDPKQSIYRFRRADVAMYDRVRQVVQRGIYLPVTLSANFRSVPPFIDWLNDRFDRVLGISPDGRPFDPTTGIVFQQRLQAGRGGASTAAVHVVPFDFMDARKHGVDEYRGLEGQVLARYLRWLVEASDVTVVDALDGQARPVRYADIAVLAVSTWNLSLLFPWLDREGIPYASRGGTLFLEDSLHRQFLLGLRALADRDDGVAEAALLRPPFFAVDLADLLQEQEADEDTAEAAGDGVRRVREARDLVRELRRRRFERPPGATARDLLDRTVLARAVALGPNGAQRLARLRELCLVLEEHAARDSLDYDAVTARMREWVNEPVQLDPPHPVGTEAVQVLTVHQAKGLEFPVVVLWDSRGQWDTHLQQSPWRIERDGRGWVMSLDGLTWEEPAGMGLGVTEKLYLDAERRRVAYVAATRVRDILVIPRAGTGNPAKEICAALLESVDAELVRVLDTYRDGIGVPWATVVGTREEPPQADADAVEREMAARWADAATEAARPRFKPASVSGEADSLAERSEAVGEDAAEAAAPKKPREGRFGHRFGHTVHSAVELMLRDTRLEIPEAVRRAAAHLGLTEHLEEAGADVRRALDTLVSEGLRGPVGPALQVEYPVAAAWEGGRLLMGYIDVVGATADRIDVIDLKTDAPPTGDAAAAYPEYAAQVRLYGRLLEAGGLAAGRRLRCGLLFTADGIVRWIDG